MNKKKIQNITEFGVDPLAIIQNDMDFISYRKELKQITGSITAAILLQQISYRWGKQGRTPFYKFKEPCDHPAYKEGDSWCEELGFTRAEFDTALSKIGCKTSKNKTMQENKFVRYWTTQDRLTYYTINYPALAEAIFQHYQPKDSSASKPAISTLQNTTEITSKITSKITKESASKSKTLFSTNQEKSPSPPLRGTPPPQIPGSENQPPKSDISERFNSSTNSNIPDQSQTPLKHQINPLKTGNSQIPQTTILNPTNNNREIGLVEFFYVEMKKRVPDSQIPKTPKGIQEELRQLRFIIDEGHTPELIKKAIQFVFGEENDGFWVDRVSKLLNLKNSFPAIINQMPQEDEEGFWPD